MQFNWISVYFFRFMANFVILGLWDSITIASIANSLSIIIILYIRVKIEKYEFYPGTKLYKRIGQN